MTDEIKFLKKNSSYANFIEEQNSPLFNFMKNNSTDLRKIKQSRVQFEFDGLFGSDDLKP